MKISKKAYYGLRAVLALGQAAQPLSIHALAARERLPEEYLEKIMQTLRRARIVQAKKGVMGGYMLAKPVTAVSAWDVLRVLDGPLQIFRAPVSGALPCLQVSHCQSNRVWRNLEMTIEASLEKIKIADLLAHRSSV